MQLNEVQTGMPITWHLIAQGGGYHYEQLIPGKVLGTGASRVRIEIRMKNGGTQTRWVDPRNLERQQEKAS